MKLSIPVKHREFFEFFSQKPEHLENLVMIEINRFIPHVEKEIYIINQTKKVRNSTVSRFDEKPDVTKQILKV